MITREEWESMKKDEPYSLYLDSIRRIERIESFLDKTQPIGWSNFKITEGLNSAK